MRERTRIWTESVETFVRDVITEERRDKRAASVRLILFLLSRLYHVGIRVRRFVCDM